MALECWRRILVGVTIGAACAAVAVDVPAQSPDSEPTRRRIESLVRQLGSDSFETRQLAAKTLLEYGMQTKEALAAGATSGDPEIALRCRRLWREVRFEAGWKQVRELIGDSPPSRELFDQMCLADPDLWYALAETPRPAETIFEERRLRLRELLKDQGTRGWEGALANLLYFGVRVKRQLPQQELPRIDDLLNTGRTQQALADYEPLRRLWVEWTKATNTDGPRFDRLLVALRERRPEALEIAREMLGDERTPVKQRQYALLALVRSDRPDDDRWIDAALQDASSLDVAFIKGRVVKSELRDVALAVRIVRRGRNPVDFGFVDARADAGMVYSPSSLGFRGSAERDAAFQRWAAFAEGRAIEASP